jgi:hypothetical protein
VDALEAFQLFTGRQTPRDFSQVRPTDPRAHGGGDLFFGSNCVFCHLDLSGQTFNQNFDTGVANLVGDLPQDDGFLATGTFNVPPLAEAADTPPLFHNNAAATIEDAVAFYVSPTFQNSPSSALAINFNDDEQAQVAAFLRVVNASENIRQVRKRAAFVQRQRSAGNTAILTAAIADSHDAIAVLSAKKLNPAVQKQLREVEWILLIARLERDAHRPFAMVHAISLLDKAENGLFAPRNGGGGGTGGAGDGDGFDGGFGAGEGEPPPL